MLVPSYLGKGAASEQEPNPVTHGCKPLWGLPVGVKLNAQPFKPASCRTLPSPPAHLPHAPLTVLQPPRLLFAPRPQGAAHMLPSTPGHSLPPSQRLL